MTAPTFHRKRHYTLILFILCFFGSYRAFAGPSDFTIACLETLKSVAVNTLSVNFAKEGGIEGKTLESPPRLYDIALSKRIGFGVTAGAYTSPKIEGLGKISVENATPLVVKIPHHFKFFRLGVYNGSHSAKEENYIYETLRANLSNIEKSSQYPIDPAWKPGSIPTAAIYDAFQTRDHGFILVKPLIKGKGLKEIYAKYKPDTFSDLPESMQIELHNYYQMVQAMHEVKIQHKGKEELLSIDINPTNLVWVDDPEVLKSLGLSRPSFYTYELGTIPYRAFHADVMPYETYKSIFMGFLKSKAN